MLARGGVRQGLQGASWGPWGGGRMRCGGRLLALCLVCLEVTTRKSGTVLVLLDNSSRGKQTGPGRARAVPTPWSGLRAASVLTLGVEPEAHGGGKALRTPHGRAEAPAFSSPNPSTRAAWRF